MNILAVASKAAKIANSVGKTVGVLPSLKGRKKRLTAAIGGLVVALLVSFGVPPEIAEALAEVFQALAVE